MVKTEKKDGKKMRGNNKASINETFEKQGTDLITYLCQTLNMNLDQLRFYRLIN